MYYLHIIQIFLNATITTLCDHDNVHYLLNYQSCQPVYIYTCVSGFTGFVNPHSRHPNFHFQGSKQLLYIS